MRRLPCPPAGDQAGMRRTKRANALVMNPPYELGIETTADHSGALRPCVEQSANGRRLVGVGRMGSASDEDGSTLCGRRAEWNLSAPWVGPSLLGMSACRTVRSGVSIEYGIGERKKFARCLLIQLSPRVCDAGASLLAPTTSLPDLHHAARMFRKLRQPLLLLQFLGPSMR